MSDPICGPLIHNFVDETLDHVNSEKNYFINFENRKEKEGNIWKSKIYQG